MHVQVRNFRDFKKRLGTYEGQHRTTRGLLVFGTRTHCLAMCARLSFFFGTGFLHSPLSRANKARCDSSTLRCIASVLHPSKSIRLPEHSCPNHNKTRAHGHQSIHAKNITTFVFQEHTMPWCRSVSERPNLEHLSSA